MARAKLTAFVGLNTSAFRRGLRSMRRRWRSFKATVVAPMARFGRTVGRAFLRGGMMIGIAMAGAVKHANDFRKQMALVNTMLDGQDLQQYADGILKMSARFGMAKEALTKGLYDILSAGVAAESGLSFLEVATRAAIGGATDTAVAVDGLTSVMNAYGMQAKEVGHVSDVMFQIVKDGKITYDQLAENIGKIAPTARAAGLTLEQLGAAIATMVKVEKPERAMTALRQSLFEAAEMGLDLFQLAEKFKGATLEDIIAAGIPKKTAAGVVLLGNNFQVLNEEVEKFKNVAGRADEAFQKQENVRHWARAWQTILKVVTQIGVALDKALAPSIDFIRAKLDEMSESPAFKNFLVRLEDAATRVAAIMASLATGGAAKPVAMQGLKNVLIGMWELAVQHALALLIKAVPLIGKGIWEGFKMAMTAPGKAAGRFAYSRREAAKMAARGEIDPSEIGEAAKSIRKWLEMSDMDKITAKLEKQLGLDLPSASNRLKTGLEQLSQAAAMSQMEQMAYMESLKKDGEDFDGDEVIKRKDERGEFTPERDFSELRKMGANILGGFGAPSKADKAQKTREEMLAAEKKTEEAIQQMRKDMADFYAKEDILTDDDLVFD